MSVYVDGVNLTKLSDAKLKAIATKMFLSSAEVRDQYSHLEKNLPSQLQARAAVRFCRQVISAWESVSTVTTHSAPSPESFAWSNLEGGHTFHQEPSFRQWLQENGFGDIAAR